MAKNGKEVVMAGLIAHLRPHTTKKGDAMAFGSLEDLEGKVDLLFFPRTWKEYRGKIRVATVVSFVVFMGLAQVMQLLLNLSASMDQASIRFGEISLALGELRADTKKTKEQVRLVGSLVYEEAKKEDG